ncbi:two-component sensor histidine kinase [Exilibacterium tricleocarpae]|uniref:histidine kinase n=1 Tax=Exilibacterium tricleocarpae TaxID=2591008 RepID=A0A545TFK2_9GAMM|nr:ATP-binding protein [Exilibacterium tricleocarpae]TQV76009.1 two-component sensor histidine kinase [Exilibacterium tricleocarpae]
MDDIIDYKAAYSRQKKAREKAEDLLENRSRELYDTNRSLRQAYDKLRDQKAQLLHQEKLASIGQLSAGVAHEINNPTSFVKSNLTTLKRYGASIKAVLRTYDDLLLQLEKESLTPEVSACLNATRTAAEEYDVAYIVEDIDSLIDDGIDGTERIHDIVQNLKNFARIDDKEEEQVDINACIENTLKLVSSELKYKCEVAIEFGELPPTYGFPGHLQQVFLNLFVNASQAIDDFGRIDVATCYEEEQILVMVSDTGRGMEEEIIKDIFNPFFTTKEVGVGTGLGLSISHGIIKKHGGAIEVTSTPGRGTTFVISLPVKPQASTGS